MAPGIPFGTRGVRVRRSFAARVVGEGSLGCATLTLLLAMAASPAAGAFLAPAGGELLRPGQIVTVRWGPPAAGVCELELLLLLDEGSVPVRLTEQLAPGDGCYRWRVPNLPSRKARLQIRFSRGRGEELGSTSAPFHILPRTATGLAELGRRGGEWWVVRPGADAMDSLELPQQTVLAHRLPAWPLEPLAAAGEREPLPPPVRLAVGAGSACSRDEPPPVAPRTVGRAPVVVPQRE